MKRKEVDDVMGGEGAWDNVDQTEMMCPVDVCEGQRAYFYMVQIRSADEPMTTFYKVRFERGKRALVTKTDADAGSVLLVAISGGKVEGCDAVFRYPACCYICAATHLHSLTYCTAVSLLYIQLSLGFFAGESSFSALYDGLLTMPKTPVY
jgi:hypothetical protein